MRVKSRPVYKRAKCDSKACAACAACALEVGGMKDASLEIGFAWH